MLNLSIHETSPGTQRPDKEQLRATPTTAFLDFDPILPDWPTRETGSSPVPPAALPTPAVDMGWPPPTRESVQPKCVGH
jgi:hypothetical protein